jgi:hypothetical protein
MEISFNAKKDINAFKEENLEEGRDSGACYTTGGGHC